MSDTCAHCLGTGEIEICPGCQEVVDDCVCERPDDAPLPPSDIEECSECEGTGVVGDEDEDDDDVPTFNDDDEE